MVWWRLGLVHPGLRRPLWGDGKTTIRTPKPWKTICFIRFLLILVPIALGGASRYVNLRSKFTSTCTSTFTSTCTSTSKVTSKVTLQDDLQDNLQDSFRTEGTHQAGVGTKRLCAAADPTALRASPATVPGLTPSHPTFMGRVPTQVCYSPFPPS